MPEYELNINFQKEDLEELYTANYKVVVAKPNQGEGGSGRATIAWQSFKPMEKNKITWHENYGIYASSVTYENGAELMQMSQTEDPAAMRKLYTMEPQGCFGAPGEAMGPEEAFYAINRYQVKKKLTIGLYQDAVVNGKIERANAVSAATVLTGHTVQMIPHTNVYIWVQADVKSNTVVSHITSPQTMAEFGAGVAELSYDYDLASGVFMPEGPAV